MPSKCRTAAEVTATQQQPMQHTVFDTRHRFGLTLMLAADAAADVAADVAAAAAATAGELAADIAGSSCEGWMLWLEKGIQTYRDADV